MALLEQWIKHEVIQFPEVESLSTTEDMKHLKDCMYHRKRGYSLKHCYSFQRVFNDKHKAGEVLLQEDNTSINTLPFLKHDGRDKGHVMMASHREVGVEKVDEKMSEAEPDLIGWLNKIKICSNSSVPMIKWISIQISASLSLKQ